MSRMTIDFGIDLGTTNSAIAVMDGTRAAVIKNNDNLDYTPSAVYIDNKGNMKVGRFAKQRIELEPDDAYAEFKLQMGAQAEYRFARSGRVMHPEDLSAEILKSLRADVQQRLNEDLQAAVITVPAAFELPQCEATKRAAQLAGIQTSPLIMEPTAAAMAHAFQTQVDKVFWLVYDFGGGTFDAAVIQIREGTFRIVNHSGDNHLGGKLIDWEIVESLLAPAAARDHHLGNFARSNPKWRKAFAKLKLAAEEAKIRLSQDDSVQIYLDYLCNDDNGEAVAFEYELRRADVARLAEPFIQRTINISRQALAEKRLSMTAIQKVVLVGGPTLAPYVRDHLNDPHQGLGIPLDFSIDPLTVVAQGAAIFASSQRLEGVPMTGEEKKTTYQIELEYDPVGADVEPVVGGQVRAPEGQSLDGLAIEFINPGAQPAWRSGRINLGPNGSFMTTLWAQRGKSNTFRIELFDASGARLLVQPDHFNYTIGITPDAPPLIHSVGVALANNEVRKFFEKGTPLPARQRRDLKTAATIHMGAAGEFIHVPVIEGDNARADRNRLIGTLSIPAVSIRRDVPAGSDVEVTIEIDESRLLKTSAYIPILDLEVEEVHKLDKPTPDIDRLEDELEREKKRLEAARRKAHETNDEAAQRIIQEKVEGEQMVEQIDTSLSAAGGDRDAADKAQNRLIDLKVTIDQVEDALEWPALVAEAQQQITNTRQIIHDYGDEDNRQLMDQLEQGIQQAIRSRDVDQLRRLVEDAHGLALRILVEKPEFWGGFFQHLQEKRSLMRDRAQADQLFAQGQIAMQNNDVQRLKAVVQQLIALLPSDQQEELRGGFGSGVI
ncbi:MAG: Hsp70 family protein [Anaerolineales bacterium]|nr:Hsp70 family protein [Anaerolineales bacterium]